MLCVEEDDLFIYGDFSSLAARQINIQLHRCRGGLQNGCKSEAEITQFFKRKYLLLLTN